MPDFNSFRSPSLESVRIVENTIRRYSQECGKIQLWEKLPEKIVFQTFQFILGYLKDSGKILIDEDGCIMWVFDPEGIRNVLSKDVVLM
jgi:hypothetical protein